MSPLNGLFLPDRRLWACTCPAELYPGPVHSNGNHSAPGIDALEATVDDGVSKVLVSSPISLRCVTGFCRGNLCKTPLVGLANVFAGVS